MQRESMEFDVVIVGAGPAGLAAACRLAQLSQAQNTSVSICVLEKGASIGAHSLSGAILEPASLQLLFPDWQERSAPLHTPVTNDSFYFLTETTAKQTPSLPVMKNHGNFIISLGELCQWLAEQAEQMGVNVFPGFAASKILYDDPTGAVKGVQTSDMGLDKAANPTGRFEPGMNLLAKQTIFAEGCRGSLSEQVIKHFNLKEKSSPQSYAIGIKELWRIKPEQHKAGEVLHTVGWPLDNKTYGGSFVYHFKQDLLSIGLVIGLDYQNPYLDPFKELQRFKTHPKIQSLLAGGECVSYGARALNEGGYQAIPKLTFPGGMLVGCGAGFVNVAKIKGIHNAIKSGVLAAESVFDSLESAAVSNLEIYSYQAAVEKSSIMRELYKVRNIRPAFHKGLWPGVLYAAFDQYILRGHAPWTFSYRPDHAALRPAKDFTPIEYPKPDGKISFDKLTQVSLTATQHREDEPCHLYLKDAKVPVEINLKRYDMPEQRYCPAGVYELIKKDGKPALQINAANCIHCKTCDIKDPTQNIVWKVPEGGEGPNYSQM